MKLAILHIGDIHISTEHWPDNPILKKADKIVTAINSLFSGPIDGSILLVAGDIAYAGLNAEYDLAKPLLQELMNGAAKAWGCNPNMVFLPGNHDCDFEADNQARRQLIADPNLNAFNDGSIIDICTGVQDSFFEFCKGMNGDAEPVKGIDRIYRVHQYRFGSADVTVRVLNSSWCSQKKERPGSLLMPTEVLKPFLEAPANAELVITAMHHPYSWLEPNVKRQLKEQIECSTDLVFTGHEHDNQSYRKTGDTGEQIEYIEGGALQETNSPTQSEFNVVFIDTEAGSYVVHHFAWTDGIYEVVKEPHPHAFIRNNSRLTAEFQINDQFREQLQSTDTAYQHQFKDEITLDDLYIYPDFREYSPAGKLREKKVEKSKNRGPGENRFARQQSERGNDVQIIRHTVKSKEFLDYVLNKGRMVITASDRAGKTALSRTLVKDLWRNGRLPVLVNAGEIDPSRLKHLPKELDALVGEQYHNIKPIRYWSLSSAQRAVIVDDYHKLPNIRTLRAAILAELTKRFDTIILIGGPSLRFQELRADDTETSLLSDFEQLEMMGFGHRLRSQLIRRWFLLGRDGTIDDDEVERQVIQLEKVIGIVIGGDLLPPFPAYILLLLQQMELRLPIDTTAASYGKLYSAFMTACLANRKCDLETALTYLSELAYHFFNAKIDHLDETGFQAWHGQYNATYQDQLDSTLYLAELTKAGILSHRNGIVQFRVKAAFYYFVAQYLSAHFQEDTIRDQVKELAAKLYKDDAANITLFLCHLNRHPSILGEVLANANRLFGDRQEADLMTDLKFTGELVAKLTSPVLEDGGDTQKRRQQWLEHQDAIADNSDPNDDMYAYVREEETEAESEQRRQIAQVNAAMKTIQITGQIARSFAGSLKGHQRQELVNATYSLALRLLRFMYDSFEFIKDDLGKALQAKMKKRDEKRTDLEAAELANATIFLLIDMLTYSVIRHVAGSIGVEKLALTFAEVRDSKKTVGVRTFDIAIQLEHFKHIPIQQIVELYKDVKQLLLMKSVVQHLIWDRLYYQKTPGDVAQQLCGKCDITLLPGIYDNDQKKT